MVTSVHVPNIEIALPSSVSTRDTWAPGEIRGFQFFQERFAAGLKANGAAGPFWNELIPQSSETYPAVKHMAVAIASLQENLEKVHLNDSNGDAGPEPSMSLEQCNLGIQELIASVRKTTPKEIMLTTCILLIWFELLRSNPRASSKYLDLGLGMLQKPKADVLHLLTDAKAVGFVGPPSGTVQILEAVFSKITATEQYSGWGMDKWTDDNRIDLNHFDKHLPASFGHLIELWTHADILLMFLNRVVRNLSNRTHIPSNTKFVTVIDQKLVNFVEEYTRLDGANSPLATPQVSTLSSLFNMAHIIRHCLITGSDEMAYDKCTPQFKEIVRVLRTGLRKVAQLHPSKDRLTIMPFGIWAVGRLYMVASNCRDPPTRRDAIDLLFSYPRREAALDGWTAGKIAECKMKIEEKSFGTVHSCAEIPASSRIRIHDATFDAATRHVVLRYMHAPYDETICAIEEQRIEWSEKVNDIAADDDEMIKEMLQVHALFLKASTKQAPNGVMEPMYYDDELIPTVTDQTQSPLRAADTEYEYEVHKRRRSKK